jgi:hypothetical protein
MASEERPELLGVPHLHLGSRRARRLGEIGRVLADPAPLDRVGEGLVQHGVDVAHRLRRQGSARPHAPSTEKQVGVERVELRGLSVWRRTSPSRGTTWARTIGRSGHGSLA